MKQLSRNYFLALGLAAATWLCNGQILPNSPGFLMAAAEARFGRPATAVSVAGVARRSTVRAAAYDYADDDDVVVVAPVAAGGVGGPASGIGVLPGAGAGRAGVGYSGGPGGNLGGPVNRVGVR